MGCGSRNVSSMLSSEVPQACRGRSSGPYPHPSRNSGQLNGNATHKTRCRPISTDFAVQLRDHAIDDRCAEACARRLTCLRAAALDPVDNEPLACPVRPSDLKPALGRRERAVFGGVGRQLVQDHGNRLSGCGLQQHLWPVNLRADLAVSKIGREFLFRDSGYLGSRPTRPGEQRMDLGERPDPRLDLILEAIHGLGLRKMYRCLNGRENILCPMFSFSSQSGDLPFASLSLRDVLETVDRAEDIAAAIMDRVDVDEHDAAGAVGAFNPRSPCSERPHRCGERRPLGNRQAPLGGHRDGAYGMGRRNDP